MNSDRCKVSRKMLRDCLVRGIVRLPLPLRLLLLRNFRRVFLYFLFRLEKQNFTISMAGPSWLRYRLKLNWQGYTDFVLGIHEPEVCEAIRKVVKPGQFCIDVGAHIGYYTILMGLLVGDKGFVVAFEPNPQNVAALQENVSLNRLHNVRIESMAVTGSTATVELLVDADEVLTQSASTIGYAVHNASRIVVPCCSLDDYLKNMHKNPDFIKIDVEGAEREVLRGAKETLKRGPVILVEIHDASLNSEKVVGLLSRFGYHAIILGRRGREAFYLATPT